MMTNQEMLDQAMEEGASHVALGPREWVCVTDEGHWTHLTWNGEIRIDWDRGIELKDAARDRG